MNIQIHRTEFKIDTSVYFQYCEAIGSGTWEVQTFSIIDSIVMDQSVASELGCWCGPKSFYMEAKGATVHAVYPYPAAFAAIIGNVALNSQSSGYIVPHNGAIVARGASVP